MESIDCRLQRGMDATVVFHRGHRDEKACDLGHFVDHQDAEPIESGPGVVEQVRVGWRGDGLAVPRFERLADGIGVVAEVEHEGAVFVIGNSVQA